jgi:WD40 repeat protein
MAYQSMRNGLYKRVRDRLDACPEHLRGWEWRHLDAVSDSSLVVLGNPVRKIVCADWSPDGTRVVTGAKDGSVEVWNADTGERLWVASASVASETVTTPGTPDQVMAVSWSQNGKRILSVSERGSLGVFDAATGRRQVSVEVPCVDQSFVSAALSPDGTRIAVATFGIPLRILDAESGALVVELTDGGGSDSTWDWFKTFWSPDGTKLVSLSHDGAVLWDSLAGRRIADFKLGVVLQGCFSQDGGWVAFASSSQGILSVRNARTGEKRQDVPIGQKLFACSSVDFNPTGTQVLATFDYGVVGVWSLATDVGDAGELSPARDARPSLELSGELGAIASAAYSPDGTRIVTASDDGTARIWDARFGGEIAQLKGHTAGVLSARFSPNGTRVLTTSQDGSARIWSTTASELVLAQSMRLERESIATSASAIFTDRDEQIIAAWSCDGVAELRTYDSLLGEMISRFQPHDRLKSIEATLYGRRLLTALDQRVDVCDVLSGEVLFSLEHGQPVVGVRACLDETRVVTWSGFGPAKVWSMDTGDLLSSLGTEGGSSSFAVLSPDGSRALTASHDKVARLWTAAAGRLIHQLVGHKDWICAMEFSPDGRMALTGDEKGRVFVWDTESGGLHFALQGHTKAITAATFCRQNGRRILTASEDGSARLWDAASGRCIAELLGHDGPVSDAEFSPDDSRVATASEDGGIRIWDPATGQLLADWFVGSGSLDGSPSGVQTRAEGRRAARGVASVSFSADGSRLVASVRDGTARVYDAVPYRQKHEVVESRQAVWREARRVVEAQLSAGKSIETIRQAELSSWEPASAEKSAKLSAVMGLVDERESLLRQFASLSNQWILVDGTEPRAQLERNARRLLRIAGGDAESLAMAGVALYRLDRFEDSILALSRARDSRSGPGAPNPRDLAVLAMCYWKLGEFAKAREEARHVRRLSNEEDWESKPWVQEMVWEMNEMIPLE